MKAKKHDPKSEAAQREALREPYHWVWQLDATEGVVRAYDRTFDSKGRERDIVLAIFDLRDCYRKRAPLKGVTKALRKAIAPKRKRRG
jgi:hypothetical protein